MPAIVFDDWSGGLDRRKNRSTAAAKVLWTLRNCYITPGKEIEKRACFTKVATIEAGTVGLKAGGGKLNTFYGDGAAITHANTLFQANRAPHWTSGAAPVKIPYCDTFNGVLYLCAEYAGSVFRHHFLDDPGVWVAATAYGVGTYRRPTTANGFRYEVTAIAGSGTSHATTEPTWPTTIGGTVIDNPGANQITWTCRSFAITDTNCPHTKQVAKILQRIFAGNDDTVRYCAGADPRDWTTASDAGFLPTGINAAGSDDCTALGVYREQLVVLFSDSTQVWTIDGDPANNVLSTNAPNIGTIHHRTPHPFANDLVFLASAGFRSVSIAVLTESLQENDIGSPLDALRAEISDSDDPFSIFYPRLGQLWVINGANAYVITYSKSAKITAWSTFDFPFSIDDATVLNNELYVRSGNDVYKASNTTYADDGVAPVCTVQSFFQDQQTPGVLKQFLGWDVVVKGSPTISFSYDPRDPSLESAGLTVTSDTRPGAMLPVELCATSIAINATHQANEAFGLAHAQLYYEPLGPV